ncbi:MAG: hypothetical protein DWQ31_11305 [Planctomycetota bacterium]|nr:MAG: hypothetical protein DWQ31_11305 [Planctomycetota bacterium]REJ98531.1 MAG: hypothetical protein DWQ35_00580 [Planctomycetota bacterium]REK29831.1 MAG: hypothetical protein DWQ42_02700 [Planctomycetota bacterium]REK47998.1 MAG: hypothetical protein DWQ46_03655 [Planctomycetota bacterium]
MLQAAWQIEATTAQLAHTQLAARVDLAAPDRGIENLGLASGAELGIRPMQIQLPDAAALSGSLGDFYVRGDDLVAEYDESPQRHYRTQIYWRSMPCPPESTVLGGIELIVSVNTSRLDVTSTWSLQSELSPGEFLCLASPDSTDFRPLAPVAGKASVALPADAPGVILFRPRNADWSYAEIVHPIDFRGSRLDFSPEANAQLTHDLFHRWMEKGVIVRTRMRAVVVTRKGDAAAVADCFADLRNAKLPLTV